MISKVRRAEIRNIKRKLDAGRHQDGPNRISQEGLQKKIKAFNEIVEDFRA